MYGSTNKLKSKPPPIELYINCTTLNFIVQYLYIIQVYPKIEILLAFENT